MPVSIANGHIFYIGCLTLTNTTISQSYSYIKNSDLQSPNFALYLQQEKEQNNN